ncbi:uncharacterized protein [Palaemon carinicauda]|uniref:uncharacterized protein isoform X1 n=1 Tax=Palaemon carinicauda TaxID=392227 RepID=UPI0035B60358
MHEVGIAGHWVAYQVRQTLNARARSAFKEYLEAKKVVFCPSTNSLVTTRNGRHDGSLASRRSPYAIPLERSQRLINEVTILVTIEYQGVAQELLIWENTSV